MGARPLLVLQEQALLKIQEDQVMVLHLPCVKSHNLSRKHGPLFVSQRGLTATDYLPQKRSDPLKLLFSSWAHSHMEQEVILI